MATVDTRQKNKSFLKGYGQIRSNDDEGMEAFFQAERLFFARLKRASDDARGKVSNLASDINKVESFIDMSKDFETLENELEQVIEAYRINCRTLVKDADDPQDKAKTAQDPVLGLLKKLLVTASKLYVRLEKLLDMNQGKYEALSDDEAKLIELFTPLKPEDVIQNKGMNRYLKDLKAKELVEQFNRWKPEDGIQNKAMKRYLNETSDDVARMIEQIGIKAAYYTKTEIPRVIGSQKRDKEVITNVATVSTIITAVTAAIITASVGQENPTNLFKAVNAFWFFSLALSVAAVVSSMLDLFRRSYLSCRSPGNDEKVQIPATIQTWIRNSPRIFLAMSVIAFQTGLCLLAFASRQPSATSIITAAITLLSSVALVVTISWFSWHHISHSSKPSQFSWHYISHSSEPSRFSWRHISYSPKPSQSKGTKDGIEDSPTSQKQGLNQINLSHLECGSYNGQKQPSDPPRNQTQHPSDNSNKDTPQEIDSDKAPSELSSKQEQQDTRDSESTNTPYPVLLSSGLRITQPQSLPPSLERFDPQLALNRLKPLTKNESSHPTDASASTLSSGSASAILQLSFSFDGTYLAALDSDGHCIIYTHLDPQPKEIRRIESGSDGWLLGMLWFPASNHIALKFQIASKPSESNLDLSPNTEPHYYAIYDTSGKFYGQTPSFMTEHVQLLHTIIGLAVFKESDKNTFTFELYCPVRDSPPNSNQLQASPVHVQVKNLNLNSQSQSQKLRCFSITRDDKYMIIGSDLQTPEKEETHVSVINLHSGMKEPFEMPLSQDLRRITTSTYTGRNRLIFEYNNAPPELWIFNPKETKNTQEGVKEQVYMPVLGSAKTTGNMLDGAKKQKQERNMLEMFKIYQIPHSTNIDDGHVRFGGRSDEMVIYSRDPGAGHGGAGLLTFWGRTSGSVLSLQRSPSLSEVNYAVCSHTKEDAFFIAYGLKNGDIQIWKSERGTKPGTDSLGQDKSRNTVTSGPGS